MKTILEIRSILLSNICCWVTAFHNKSYQTSGQLTSESLQKMASFNINQQCSVLCTHQTLQKELSHDSSMSRAECGQLSLMTFAWPLGSWWPLWFPPHDLCMTSWVMVTFAFVGHSLSTSWPLHLWGFPSPPRVPCTCVCVPCLTPVCVIVSPVCVSSCPLCVSSCPLHDPVSLSWFVWLWSVCGTGSRNRISDLGSRMCVVCLIF